jgi:hypothetical protein
VPIADILPLVLPESCLRLEIQRVTVLSIIRSIRVGALQNDNINRREHSSCFARPDTCRKAGFHLRFRCICGNSWRATSLYERPTDAGWCPNCQCLLWVKSRHCNGSAESPLCPQKRTSELARMTFDATAPAAWRYSPRSAALRLG